MISEILKLIGVFIIGGTFGIILMALITAGGRNDDTN